VGITAVKPINKKDSKMENDLLGPKAWEYVCDELGLGKEFDWTCEMIQSSIECKVFEYDHYKSISTDLPEGVRMVQMVYDSEYAYGIVNFGTMDINK
jgi:hypothetical protein